MGLADGMAWENEFGTGETIMTPCEKLGYKVGDLFEVLEDDTFREGSVIELIEDDWTYRPYFKIRVGEYLPNKESYVALKNVKPYKPTLNTVTNNYPDFDFKINLSGMTEAEKKVAREWLVELVKDSGAGHVHNVEKSDLLFVNRFHSRDLSIGWVENYKVEYFEAHEMPELKLSFSTSVQSWEIPEKECKKTLQLKELIDKLTTQLEEAEQELIRIQKEIN